MKELFIWLVVLSMIAFAVFYIYQIRNNKIDPSLSTWITFLLGTVLSFITYLIAEKHEFLSGILNALDVLVTFSITMAMINKRKGMKFEPFEKSFLRWVGLIFIYGFSSGDAFGSNVFTQILITIGYIPMIKKIVINRKNTESFVSWGINLSAGLFALCPAIIDGNFLSQMYAARTVTLISILMLFMVYYEYLSKNTKNNN